MSKEIIKPEIVLIHDLFKTYNLEIPQYQRPYKWQSKNVIELLSDIVGVITAEADEYRIGTLILHKEQYSNKYNIVDGQQRIITLMLIMKAIGYDCNNGIFKKTFDNKISQQNIHNNYKTIVDWFSYNQNTKDVFKSLICEDNHKKKIEFVVITVSNQAEAFQLFDSQNHRGKSLYPHDLLKAYHLREMPQNECIMMGVVNSWDSKNDEDICELFDGYLFRILKWSKCENYKKFSSNDIDDYKGIRENSNYNYAKRVLEIQKYYQITEDFKAGKDFFDMVEHYMKLKDDIINEINENTEIKDFLNGYENSSTGFKYAQKLFYCAYICYKDRFGKTDFDSLIMKKLFLWAFMLRIEKTALGMSSINKYAIGKGASNSNDIPMFQIISNAKRPEELIELSICTEIKINNEKIADRDKIYNSLKKMSGDNNG